MDTKTFTQPWMLPCVKSPFETLWCEYNMPLNVLGRAMQSFKESGSDAAYFQQVGILVTHDNGGDGNSKRMIMKMFVTFKGSVQFIPIVTRCVLSQDGIATESGTDIRCDTKSPVMNASGQFFIPFFAPVWFAIALCHAKNVTVTEAVDLSNPSDKWLRRMNQPRLSYKVLEIETAKRILREVGRSDEVGFAKALHLVRGQFATYTEDKPLFGHIVGTVWKPSHVRGDIKAGAVIKDYSVAPGAVATTGGGE